MLSIKPGEDTKMPQSNILVVGSLNMDQVVRVPHIPVLGETLLGAGSLKLTPGGKGANQAVAMARLGAAVTMAGRVGDDPFGKQLLGALQADQVDTSLIVVDQEESSGVAFIFLVPDGDNVIVVSSGANMCVGQDHSHISTIFESIAQAQALVLQLEALVEGQQPEDALRFAVYASALKVTKFGAQSGLPTRAEVEAFLHSV